jgi:phosphatidylglycerol:prolipoprotein diacylglycerol transferase
VHPHPIPILGWSIQPWNLLFLLAAAIGYAMIRHTTRLPGRAPRPMLALRWLLVVYLAALAAQLFAYAVDTTTTFLPPGGVNPVRYYLDPLFGPKTLYGVLLFLPLTALPLVTPGTRAGYRQTLDDLTPAALVVLAGCRVGCVLQGCCYGVPSAIFGLRAPAAGPVYTRQLQQGLIAPGEPPLPVVPTALLEAVGLAVLAVWALRAIRAGRSGVPVRALIAYSVLRFALEFLRDDPERNALGPLSTSQWIALAVVAGYGAWAYARAARVPQPLLHPGT